MDYLVFRLYAPMASWGDSAVGEVRGSRTEPGEAALQGLLAAALGISREDEAAHHGLRDGYRFAVAVLDGGRLLRDYHTAQVPGRAALKRLPQRTRRDELSVPKDELNTILSTRDYRQDPTYLVTVEALPGAPQTLAALAEALEKPRYVLYLGRKSCPPAAPLSPKLLTAVSVFEACKQWLAALAAAAPQDERPGWARAGHPGLDLELKPLAIRSLHWGEGTASGVDATLSVPRKDRLLSRVRWQFGDRRAQVWHRPEKEG